MAKANKLRSLDEVVGSRTVKSAIEEKELRIFQKNVREKLAYHIKNYLVSFIPAYKNNEAKKKFMNNSYGLTLWMDSESRLCMELSVEDPILLLSQLDYSSISQSLRLVLDAPGYDSGEGVPFTDGVAILPKQEYYKLLNLNRPLMAKLLPYDEIKKQRQLVSRVKGLARPLRGPTKLM